MSLQPRCATTKSLCSGAQCSGIFCARMTNSFVVQCTNTVIMVLSETIIGAASTVRGPRVTRHFGPSSNCVIMMQGIWHPQFNRLPVLFLSGQWIHSSEFVVLQIIMFLYIRPNQYIQSAQLFVLDSEMIIISYCIVVLFSIQK